MNLKNLWVNPNRKQIRIKATELLSEISTYHLGYVCFALNRIIFRSDKFWQIGNLLTDDYFVQSSDVNRDLALAYPEVFRLNKDHSTTIVSWIKPELFEKFGCNFSGQQFRIDLFTYIVDTYGDREIVFNFVED